MTQLSASAASVTLAWNPSTDPTVAGYNVYYGGVSATYTNKISAGNVTNLTLSGLLSGVTYYFAATTYNSAGMESTLSSEVSYQVPASGTVTNQPPTLNPIVNLSINENAGPQSVSLSGITSGATNENQTLTVTAVSSNTALIPNPSVYYTNGFTTGILVLTPATNANGSATITVTVNDGGASNNIVTRSFTVTVAAVNNQPTLNAIGNLSINENAGLQTVNLSGITSGAANENQTLTVTAASGNTNLIPNPKVYYTNANTTGKITFTPVAKAFGSATVTVTVNDGGTSNNIVTRNFTVTVAAVNNPPTLNPISDLTTNEDPGLLTVNLSGISSGATNENQTLTVTATSSNTNLIANPVVDYTNGLTTGQLTFTPATNATGSTVIAVTVNDGGASNNVITRSFTVTINALGADPTNQAPTLDPIPDVVLNAGAGMQKIQLTGISSGTTRRRLRMTATSDNWSLVSRPSARYVRSANVGLLSFETGQLPGTATVSVTLDNGEQNNNTVTRTFKVTLVSPAPSAKIISSNAPNPALAAILAPAPATKGRFNLTVSGASGYRYVVEASTDLVNWVPVATNTAPFTFADPQTASFAQRFYRAVQMP
ncbi:MAG TPA: Ig-like domain-containing protein [Candidatus Acidoferrum sp.]|nr:Ig-like domain-containing protein [Candidatus Acidoferrum sp.]